MLSQEATRALDRDGGDATIPLAASGTDATRALRTGEGPPRPPAPPRTVAPARGQPVARKRRGLGRLMAVFLIIVAGVVAAFVIASSGGGTQQRPIEEESIQNQVDRLQDFVNENTRR